LSTPPSNVVRLRLTALVATKRIREVARKSGTIVLSDGLREAMIRIDFKHPQLGEFLTTGKVTREPEKLAQMSGAWRCRVEGTVIAANRGAVAIVVLWNEKVYVEGVEWA
jgi:hypothetical protein